MPRGSVRLPNYRTVKGEGPFLGNYGAVWIMVHRLLPELKRAVKVPYSYLRPEVAIAEAQKQTEIKSLYVVQIYDLRPVKNPRFIVMEYCPDSLDKWLKRRFEELGNRHIPYDGDLSGILWGIVQGINDAHKVLIHGDLKPANILLDREGTPKISDFGAARHLKKEYPSLRGSSNWMAPEVLQGRQPLQESDYFSFGVLAYLLLTGEHPFFCNDRTCLSDESDNIKHPGFLVRPLQDLRSDIPTDVAEQVMALLSRGPGHGQKRRRAFANLKVLLSKVILPEPTEAPSVPVVPVARALSDTEEGAIRQVYDSARRQFFVDWNPKDAVLTLSSFFDKFDWQRFKGSRVAELADCWSLKAYIHNSGGLYVDAVEAATKGLMIDPTHVNSYHARGYAYIQLGEDEKAKQDLRAGLKHTDDERKQAQVNRLLEALRRRTPASE